MTVSDGVATATICAYLFVWFSCRRTIESVRWWYRDDVRDVPGSYESTAREQTLRICVHRWWPIRHHRRTLVFVFISTPSRSNGRPVSRNTAVTRTNVVPRRYRYDHVDDDRPFACDVFVMYFSRVGGQRDVRNTAGQRYDYTTRLPSKFKKFDRTVRPWPLLVQVAIGIKYVNLSMLVPGPDNFAYTHAVRTEQSYLNITHACKSLLCWFRRIISSLFYPDKGNTNSVRRSMQMYAWQASTYTNTNNNNTMGMCV